MTTKRILHTDREGRLAQTCVDPGSRLPGEPEEAWLERMATRLVPPGLRYAVVDISAFPPSGGRYVDCWVLSGGAVTVALPKAKQQRRRELLADGEQRLARVRRREQELREDGQNAAAAQLRARAAALRQIEAQVDADLVGIADLSGLEAYQPAAFGPAD